MTHKYLFILCPPASGSTLLHKILQTSPQTSAFNVEGQVLAKSILFTKDRWNSRKIIPWNKVEEIWLKEWDLSKPVLLEKSPPHLIRANQLETNFPNSSFIIMIRNPYAFCEGVKRRWGKNYTYYNIAKMWVICARYQIENIIKLKNCLWFTYENLTSDPQTICRDVINFIPTLEKLSPENTFNVFEKSMPITDLNHRQISTLANDDIFQINRILKRYLDLLSFFNYQLIKVPPQNTLSKIISMTSTGIKSLNRLPEPIRWHNWKKLKKPDCVLEK